MRLAALDACAVAAGVLGAFALRAAFRSGDSLAPDHILSLVLPALPFCLVFTLISLWTAGLYSKRSPSPLEIVVAFAWSAAALTFVAFYWDHGPEAPFMVIVAGYIFTTALVIGARRLQRA